MRVPTGPFGAYRGILMPEKEEEPILSGIMVEESFLKRGKGWAGVRVV